jgi:small subunit ribosomal protein S20
MQKNVKKNAFFSKHHLTTLLISDIIFHIVQLLWRVSLAVKKTSAEKRHQQSESRRLRNKSVKSESRTYAKKYVAAVHAKDAPGAEVALKTLVKALDTAAGKGILTKNAVSRKKSRMMRLYNTSFGTLSKASGQPNV